MSGPLSIFLGDALRTLEGLRPADRATREAVLELLGLELRLAAPGESGAGPIVPAPELVIPPERQHGPMTRKDEGRITRGGILDASGEGTRLRTTLRRETVLHRRAPAWLSGLEPLVDDRRNGASWPPLFEPLLQPRWTRGLITAALGTLEPTGPYDVERILARLIERRPLEALPRAARSSVHRGVQLLLDRGRGMEPYLRDQIELSRAIRALVGLERVEVLYFIGTPARGVAPSVSRLQRRVPWRPPFAGTPVLVLTDLGLGQPPFGSDAACPVSWLEFAGKVRHAGCPAIALVPYARERWPRALCEALTVLPWDRTTTALQVFHRRTTLHPPAPPPSAHSSFAPEQDRLEMARAKTPGATLARALAIAGSIEPELVRRMRINLFPTCEAGVEADLWFSPIVRMHGPRGILLEPDALAALREGLAGDRVLLERARAVVERAHRHSSLALRIEEELTYLALRDGMEAGETIERRLKQVIAALVREGGEGVAHWAMQALPGMPDVVRATGAGRLLELGAAVRLRVRLSGVLEGTRGTLPGDIAWLVPPDLPELSVGVAIERGAEGEPRLVLSEPPADGAHRLRVPRTTPMVIEVSWKGPDAWNLRPTQIGPLGQRMQREKIGLGGIASAAGALPASDPGVHASVGPGSSEDVAGIEVIRSQIAWGDRALLVNLMAGAELWLPTGASSWADLGFEQVEQARVGQMLQELKQMSQFPLGEAAGESWKRAMAELEWSVRTVVSGIRGRLHLFIMGPYATAALGQLLKKHARLIPIYYYLPDRNRKVWIPALDSERSSAHPHFFFDVLNQEEGDPDGSGYGLCIDVNRVTQPETLRAWARYARLQRVFHLQPRQHGFFSSPGQAISALNEVREHLERLWRQWEGASLHLATNGPLVFFVELCRTIPLLVYRSVYLSHFVTPSLVPGFEQGLFHPVIEMSPDGLRPVTLRAGSSRLVALEEGQTQSVLMAMGPVHLATMDGSVYTLNVGAAGAGRRSPDIIDFTALLERHRPFAGREGVMRALKNALGAPGEGQIVLVTGVAGTGKTAVAARLVHLLEEADGPAIYHFFGTGGEQDRPDVVLQSLLAQLGELFPGLPSITEPLPLRSVSTAVSTTPAGAAASRLLYQLDQLSSTWLAPRGERLVLILDSLDAMPPGTVDSQVIWLLAPESLPSGVILVVTSRPDATALSQALQYPRRVVRIDLDDPALAATDSTVLLHRNEVPGMPCIFVVGSLERHLSVYTQQVRALNLIYALESHGRLKKDDSIAVVGAGVTGLTLAAGAARRGFAVTVLEKDKHHLKTLRGCRSRWLHPHLEEWPAVGALREEAGLPVLTWHADRADEVADQILEQFDGGFIRIDRPMGVHLFCGARAVELKSSPEDATPQLSWSSDFGFRLESPSAVLLAVGPGEERIPSQLPTAPYWRDDAIEQPDPSPGRRILVSGGGDAGLVDVLRACLRDFRPDTILRELRLDPGSNPNAARLADRLLEIERRLVDTPPAGTPAYLVEAYRSLDNLSGFVDEGLQRRAWRERQVVLNGPDMPLMPGASILNRFLVSRLLAIDLVVWWQGVIDVARSTRTGGRWTIVLKSGRTDGFDEVILRHGTRPALEHSFPSIWQACLPRLREGGVEAGLEPLWPDGWFGEPWEELRDGAEARTEAEVMNEQAEDDASSTGSEKKQSDADDSSAGSPQEWADADHAPAGPVRHSAHPGDPDTIIRVEEALKAQRQRGAAREEIAALTSRLGVLYLERGDYVRSTRLLEQALRDQTDALGEDALATLDTREALGLAYAALGQDGQALACQERTISTLERIVGPEHPKTARSLTNRADTYLPLGHRELALQDLERSLDIQLRSVGEDHPDTAHTFRSLGEVELALGDPRSGWDLLLRAYAIQLRLLGETHPELGRTLRAISDAEAARGDRYAALVLLERAKDLQRDFFGEGHLELGRTTFRMGRHYAWLNEPDRAAACLGDALAIQQRTLGEHVETADTYYLLGELEAGRGERERGLVHLEKALAIRRDAIGEHDARTLVALREVVLVLSELNRGEEAYTRLEWYLRDLPERHPMRAELEEIALRVRAAVAAG